MCFRYSYADEGGNAEPGQCLFESGEHRWSLVTCRSRCSRRYPGSTDANRCASDPRNRWSLTYTKTVHPALDVVCMAYRYPDDAG
jgi:hypothetical protein